jgi:hypothetical protein
MTVPKQPNRPRKVKELVQKVTTNVTVEKIKAHVVKNKKTYIVGLVGAASTTAVLVLKSRPINIINANAPVFNNTPVFNNNVNNIVANPGYLCKMVQDLETKEIWGSLGELAEMLAEKHDIALSTARSNLSKHVNGHHPDLYGSHYKAIALRTTG